MYNYNAPWHQLKTVYLGKSYDADFYQDVKNTQIRDTLIRIATETEEDYLGIQKLLEELKVAVLRPKIETESIMDFIDVNGQINHSIAGSYTLIPRPPMQPRDSQLVIENRLIGTNSEINAFDLLNFERSSIDFDAPYVTVIGEDLIVDCKDQPLLASYIQQAFPKHKVTAVDIGGHNDAVFSPIKPGVIVSTFYHTNYKNTFPGWEVLYVENQSWNAVPEWRKFKHSNKGKWWMPGEENNPEFITFVNTWLDSWLGYVEETVFDVNLLMINEKTALVNNYNKEVFEFFKKHKVEPIIAPFRHRFFWDGGIHCITSDLYREGSAEKYIKR